MARAKRVSHERVMTFMGLRSGLLKDGTLDDDDGARVTLLRPYARLPLDSDNLSGAFKSVRDEVAAFLGVDDRSDRLHWRYVQCKSTKDLGVHVRLRIEIVPSADVDPMVLAVRVLRAALLDPVDPWVAIKQADELTGFSPLEMYV